MLYVERRCGSLLEHLVKTGFTVESFGLPFRFHDQHDLKAL